MEDELALRASLVKKINAIISEIGKVEPDGVNTHSKYKFISAEKMVAVLRDSLPKNNLSIIPEVLEYEERDLQKGIRTILKMSFTLVDCETGYQEKRLWVGADQDYGGKSLGQAVTEAKKRFYFVLFQVSSGDDHDFKTFTGEPEGNKPEYNKITKEKFKDFYEKWNGEIHGDNTVYCEGAKYQLTGDQVLYLKKQEKYKQ